MIARYENNSLNFLFNSHHLLSCFYFVIDSNRQTDRCLLSKDIKIGANEAPILNSVMLLCKHLLLKGQQKLLRLLQ